MFLFHFVEPFPLSSHIHFTLRRYQSLYSLLSFIFHLSSLILLISISFIHKSSAKLSRFLSPRILNITLSFITHDPYHHPFTLSSYISLHFICHPLSTFSCHKHTVVTNILTTLITFFFPSHFRFHSIFITHPRLQITFYCALFLFLFSPPSSTICPHIFHFIHQPNDHH